MLIGQKLVYDSHHKLKLLPFSLYVAGTQGVSQKSLRTIVLYLMVKMFGNAKLSVGGQPEAWHYMEKYSASGPSANAGK